MTTKLHIRSMQESMPTNQNEKSTADHGEKNAKHQTPTPPSFPTARLWRRVVFFTLAFVVIEALLLQSNKDNGLGPSLPGLYYVWKLGPFVVLSLASGFWNQAAEHVKEAVSHHRTNDPRGISSFATLGRFLIASSAGLSFQLLDFKCVKLERQPTSLVAHSEFLGVGYDGTAVDAGPALAVANVYGLGEPWPAGTTDQYAFQSFSAAVPSREVGSMVAGMVDLLEPDLQCEVGSVVNWAQLCSSSDCLGHRLSLTLSTSSCLEYTIVPFEKPSDSAKGYYANVVSSSCRNRPDNPMDPQLIFVAARWNDDDLKVSSIVCSPKYSISQAHISLHQGNGSIFTVARFHINDGTSERQIPGVTPVELATGFMSTLRNADILLPEALGGFSIPTGVHESFFYRVANLSSPHLFEDLLDTSALQNISSQLYTSITAQVAKQYLLRETHKAFEGDSFGNVMRVKLDVYFARLLEGCFGVLVLLALAMLARRPLPDKGRGRGPSNDQAEGRA